MSANFFGIEYDIIEELSCGTGIKMRLVENIKTKRRAIQTWGSMRGEWVITSRYSDVASEWAGWVKTVNSINGK
jgi:hypothetical protein